MTYDKHSFGNWLIAQLQTRNLTQSDLAKAAGLSRQGISGVVTGFRRPGTQICLSIAKALNIPPEEVMAAAGILPSQKTTTAIERVVYLMTLLPEDDQSDVLDYILLKIQQLEKRNKNLNK